MAVLHGLGRLYRLTGESRYLKMAREIEKTGNGPVIIARWSRRPEFSVTAAAMGELHDLQGLLELRIRAKTNIASLSAPLAEHRSLGPPQQRRVLLRRTSHGQSVRSGRH